MSKDRVLIVEDEPDTLFILTKLLEKNNYEVCSAKNGKVALEIIDEFETTFDMEKRVKLAHEFHRILHEEQPYNFLFSEETLRGRKALRFERQTRPRPMA